MTASPAIEPHVSFVMPCYNEESLIGYTIPRLCRAFLNAGYRLELVAVDNGSSDRTGEIIARLKAEGYPIVPWRVEVNQGYGFGVLSGLPLCTAPWVGIIPADGQVDAEDVVRLYESCHNCARPIVAKVFRRFRLDGSNRAVVTAAYNTFMHLLWPAIGSYDVNGSPKIVHRDVLKKLDLRSKDWLLDPELMIKASMLGVEVLEMNAFSRMREGGASHVTSTTALQFLRRLTGYKLGQEMVRWRKSQGL
jgi:glycosyltransferase involved in cell wall biosynthesis